MCNFWSCVVTKDGSVFFDEMSDSHENAIAVMKKERPGVKDSTCDPDKMQFARVEITPPNGDAFAPLKDWMLRVDENIIPSWFGTDHEKAVKKALFQFAKSHFFVNTNDLKFTNQRIWLRNSSAELRESSSAELWESSRAVLRESSRAVLRESSSAELWGSSSAVLWGSSRAVLRGSSRAVLRESSRAVLRESSSAETFSEKSDYTIEKGSHGLVILRNKKDIEIVCASDAVAKITKQKESKK